MKHSQSLVAKQYAKAFVMEYGDSLTLVDVEHMKSAISFFKRHHNFMSLISVVAKMHDKKHAMIDEIFSHFSLPQSLKKLVRVMIRHKRLLYFAQALQDICCLYGMRCGNLDVTIQSAVPLTQSEIVRFEMFFQELSGKRVISRVLVEESLIAGVRMQSDLFLWEHSIAARLRKLHQNMLIEG